MKVKKFHGNITILTLFILLSCALMGILVALYMKNFIRYSDEITSYEKTNYLAKAGTELGLAIVGSREVGLEYSIDSGNLINGNFDCPFPKEEGEECPVESKFSITIDGLGDSYQNCSTEGLKQIKPGLSAIIPLYKDAGVGGGISTALTKQGITKRNIEGIRATGNGNWNYGIVWMEEDDNTLHINKWAGNINQIYSASVNPKVSDIKRSPFFIAANANKAEDPSDENEVKELTQSICIQGGEIAQETVKIVSIGYYNNRQLGTETLTTKSLPSFLQGDNYIY